MQHKILWQLVILICILQLCGQAGKEEHMIHVFFHQAIRKPNLKFPHSPPSHEFKIKSANILCNKNLYLNFFDLKKYFCR